MEVTNDNLPWVEKYRPSKLKDIVSQGVNIDVIRKSIKENRMPHILFYGPPGTGKTTTALAIAKKLYGDEVNNMVLEINGSDDRNIDMVRTTIKFFAQRQSLFMDKFKLVILDECDGMTSDAQAALRVWMEKFAKTTRFILICNYYNKIIPALVSRCYKMRFSPMDPCEARTRILYIIERESVRCTEDGLDAIMCVGAGDMRKYINVLQCTHMAFDMVTREYVYKVIGAPDQQVLQKLYDSLISDNLETAVQNIQCTMKEYSMSSVDVLRELNTIIMDDERLESTCKITIVNMMSELENRLSSSVNVNVQIGALVSVFISNRKCET